MGSTRQGSSVARRSYTRMYVTDSDKHSSLLRNGIN